MPNLFEVDVKMWTRPRQGYLAVKKIHLRPALAADKKENTSAWKLSIFPALKM